MGDADDQYEANGPAATEKTAKTAKIGNANDRVACGVVERD